MNSLHNKLCEKSNLYRTWHESLSHSFLHWFVLIAVAVIVWSFFSVKGSDWITFSSQQNVVIRLQKPSAILSLDPQTKQVNVGDIFSADIVLDTGGKPVDGVDIYSLHYDPSILQVVDDVSSQKGAQIKPGNIMSINVANIVEEKTGTIKYGQVTGGGQNFNGRGVLATVHFKAISAGTSYLKFDFNRGSTIDTNVAHKGKDQLVSVVDAVYVVSPK